MAVAVATHNVFNGDKFQKFEAKFCTKWCSHCEQHICIHKSKPPWRAKRICWFVVGPKIPE